MIFFVVSAPSGTGKTTVLKKIMERDPELMFSISHTTRKPRPGENNGIDYHFVSKDEFIRMRDAGAFIEWADVHGEFYGTARSGLENIWRVAKIPVLDIDPQGAIQVKEKIEIGVYIFIAPPSVADLRERLDSRGTDSPEIIEVRMRNAREEIKKIELYDYLIFNDNIENCIEELEAVIKAEKIKLQKYNFDADKFFGESIDE